MQAAATFACVGAFAGCNGTREVSMTRYRYLDLTKSQPPSDNGRWILSPEISPLRA